MNYTTEIPDPITVSKAELTELLRQNEEYKQDLGLFRTSIMKFCGVLGITTPDEKQIKPEILTGDDSVVNSILSSGAGLLGLFGQASIPGLKKRAEEKIQQKFAFFKDALPLIQKYGR